MKYEYVVIAKIQEPSGRVHGVLHEYLETEEEAATMFEQCLKDQDLLESDLEVLAWGRIVDDGSKHFERETVDWFRYLSGKAEIAQCLVQS